MDKAKSRYKKPRRELFTPRLAVLGCGAVVERHIARALRRIDWLPSVLVDAAPKRFDLISRQLGSEARKVITATDWLQVRRDFDAAIVALPHVLHGPVGKALAEEGKHVFMEKPLATSARECTAMVDAAEARGIRLSVGLLRRYLHVAQWTKALLASGNLGEILRFEAREGVVVNYDISSSFILHPDTAGGGVLMDRGAHTLDLLIWWLGDVASLEYRDDAVGGVEADCVIECRMACGAIGRLELSRTRDLRNSILIEGSKGFVEVHLYRNEVLGGSSNALTFEYEGTAANTMPTQAFSELFEAELFDFRTAILSGEKKGVAGVDAIKSVELIERCYGARKPLVFPWRAGTQSQPPFASSANVVVIGASGFIGGRIVERLSGDKNLKVRSLIRNLGRGMRLARLQTEIVAANLTDAGEVNRAIAGADFVLNCAYDLQSHRQNLDIVRNLLEACARHSVRRFVHLSSFSVYHPFPEGPLNEDTRDGDPSLGHVSNKLAVEKMVLALARQLQVPATVVQPSIVYGPFCRPWTNTPAEMLIFGEVILPDDGSGICSPVYIDDLVDGILQASVSPQAIGERFIMSGPDDVTWATFFSEFARALGTPPPSFWPSKRILRHSHGTAHAVRAAFSNPMYLIKTIVRSSRGRTIAQTVLDAIPGELRTRLLNAYSRSGVYRVGQMFIPDSFTFDLYRAKATVASKKARQLLGYNPSVTFSQGMALSQSYLQWAYGDVQRSISSRRQVARE